MTVDAQARDGFVTLTGTVEWHYQREAAESAPRACPAWLASQRHRLAEALDARAAADAISCVSGGCHARPGRLSVETFSGGL